MLSIQKGFSVPTYVISASWLPHKAWNEYSHTESINCYILITSSKDLFFGLEYPQSICWLSTKGGTKQAISMYYDSCEYDFDLIGLYRYKERIRVIWEHHKDYYQLFFLYFFPSVFVGQIHSQNLYIWCKILN